VKIISLVFVTLGLFALLGAITVGVDVHGKRSLRILWIVPVVVGAVVVSLLLNPFLMLLGVPAGVAAHHLSFWG
jgi:ABC-type sugar transport system permease subunit